MYAYPGVAGVSNKFRRVERARICDGDHGMTRRGVLGLLTAALMLGGCSEMFPHKYRFRMTVEIDTPQGLRRGSSVYQVWANDTTAVLPEEAKRDWGVKGEAVAVDLPGGGTLFALLKTVNPMREDLARMSMAALDPAFNNDIVESAGRIADGNHIRSPAEVAPSDYPMLVKFDDIADPKSVKRVEPTNLAAAFGPGVRLKRITVEVTDDNVTTGIAKTLKWLPMHKGSLDYTGRLHPDNSEKDLTPSAFIKGTK